MSCRRSEHGYIPAAMHDPSGRRGIYFREVENGLDVCGGREGDDWLASFRVGDTITKEQIDQLQACLETSATWLEMIGIARARQVIVAIPEKVDQLNKMLYCVPLPSVLEWNRQYVAEEFVADYLQYRLGFPASVFLTTKQLGVSHDEWLNLHGAMEKALAIVFEEPCIFSIDNIIYKLHWKAGLINDTNTD